MEHKTKKINNNNKKETQSYLRKETNKNSEIKHWEMMIYLFCYYDI